ncbi:MAG: transcriptional regulator [Bacteroidetes bacterium GWF2_42_66]|nr:MAG: transcriptional regulator [Bacteroidetes bacterium GWA2_42_15]OFX97653.1 MAG: transcriptional regulator [Bacteroidetes bacterium GWE2_42_39]OFY46901.1 MAG: transcriptional regulator [Bacteroidetes bacterium GWF2_42_66]HBL75741.1 response regulator [Prolixibacteraceae bacterium]HCR92020.1 response regulator [Prolixibacteraceae bacterium]
MKILVCEDDFMMLKTIEHKLLREGYEVELAQDGKIAFELLRENQYDFVITDLLMPYSTGLEIIDLIRNQLKQTIPIIVLSKVGMEKTVLQAFDMGTDDYIVKPFSPNELSMRIKRLIASGR